MDGILCLCCCALLGKGVHPDELCLLPELLHCLTQWFFLPQPLHTVPKARHSPWLCEHPHLPQVFLEGLSEKTLTKHLFEAKDWSSYWVPLSEPVCVSIFMASPLMSLGHFKNFVMCELLWLGIVDKLPNLKVSSSMVEKVYLMWLLFLLLELAP